MSGMETKKVIVVDDSGCADCGALECELFNCQNCGKNVCADCWYGYDEDMNAEVCYFCKEENDSESV